MTFKQIAESMVGKPKTIQIPDLIRIRMDQKELRRIPPSWKNLTLIWSKDMKSRKSGYLIRNLPECMYESWVSLLKRQFYNADGSFRAVAPIFWVYYPDMRPLLAKYEAYNGKNYGARMSWEELV